MKVYCDGIPRVRSDVSNENSATSLDNDRELSLLFSDKSVFRPVVPALFKRLEFGNFENFISVRNREICIAPKRGIVPGSALLEQIFRACGVSIKKVRFGDMRNDSTGQTNDKNDKTIYAFKLAVLVLKHCPNIKEMTFSQTDTDITPGWIAEQIMLNRFASQLTTLFWYNDLPQGTTELGACSNLRWLTYSAGTCEALIQLLGSVGATLEHLHINIEFDDARDSAALVDVLYDECRHLNTLRIFQDSVVVQHVGEPRYVALLCSYGYQLVNAKIHCLILESQRNVVESCTGLRFFWQRRSNDELLDAKQTEVISARIHSLRLYGTLQYRDAWRRALFRCDNLRSLGTDDIEVFSMIPSLARLDELIFQADSLTQQDITLIASKTSNLTLICFDLSGHIENGTIFEPLVESNNHLRHAIIYERNARTEQPLERPPTNCALRVLTQLCDTFSNCKVLTVDLCNTRGLVITEKDLQKACAALPYRGVETMIRIGRDVSYQQTG